LTHLHGNVRLPLHTEHSGWILELNALLSAALPRPIFKMILIEEATMERTAVDVHFDSVNLFLDMSEGPAVQFPLDWFPVLQAASAAEREHFAISLDHAQIFCARNR